VFDSGKPQDAPIFLEGEYDEDEREADREHEDFE